MPKILHFEDDTFLRGMYETKFKMLGFEYIGFDSPTKDPVSIVASEKPDLIIMDIIMPISDGFTATRQIKADPSTKEIPILGLCNLGQRADIQKALDLGMTDYLVTAAHMPGDVVNKVRQILKIPTPKNEKPVSGHVALDTLSRLPVEPLATTQPPIKKKSWWQRLIS